VLAQYKSPRPTLAAQLRRRDAPDYRTSQSGAKPAVSGGRLARRRTAPSDETEQLAGRPAAKRRRRPARTASASTISGVKHQRQPIPPRRARDPQPMTAPGATTARARQSDQRRRGPRARVRTHRSDRYRSDLSRDPPSAAASAHETRRVLLGSCKPVPAGRFAPQSPIPGKAICLFLPFRMSRRARQKSLICRRVLMARGGLEPPTPRFSVVVQNLSNIGGIPANTPVCAGRWRSADRRELRLFIAGLGTGTRSGAQSGPLCLGRCACDGWAPTRVNQTATASRRSRMRRWRAGFSTSAARIRADSRALPSPRSARSR
jgi:hypothetical protein